MINTFYFTDIYTVHKFLFYATSLLSDKILRFFIVAKSVGIMNISQTGVHNI
jgi:hypothetical protein